MKNLNKKAVSLVAAIAIMLLMAVMGLSLASMLGTTSRASTNYIRTAQAYTIAQGGLNWYVAQAASTVDWTNASGTVGMSLGQGIFDVNLSNKSSSLYAASTGVTEMTVKVTGKVSFIDRDGVTKTITRAVSQILWKLPSAAKFALFTGRTTVTALALGGTGAATALISGDVWTQESATIPTGSRVTSGFVYRPTDETVTGTGAYSTVAVSYPYFSNFSGATSWMSMPNLNNTAYSTLINSYNTMLAGCATATTWVINASTTLAGQTICKQTVSTNTANSTGVTISGYGTIIGWSGISLNYSTVAGTSRSLAIRPSGGDIVFLAGSSLFVGSSVVTASASTVIAPSDASSKTVLYSRSTTATTTQGMNIWNRNTRINKALIMSGRRVSITQGPVITNSTIFVPLIGAAGSARNGIEIWASNLAADSTIVGTATEPCIIISQGHDTNTGLMGLNIRYNPQLAGIIYQYSGIPTLATTTNLGITGGTRIRGAWMVNQFRGNAASRVAITYDPAVLKTLSSAIGLPVGFDGFATKEPDSESWD